MKKLQDKMNIVNLIPSDEENNISEIVQLSELPKEKNLPIESRFASSDPVDLLLSCTPIVKKPYEIDRSHVDKPKKLKSSVFRVPFSLVDDMFPEINKRAAQICKKKCLKYLIFILYR